MSYRNHDEMLAKHREYNAKHREEINAKSVLWRATHREEKRVQTVKWRAAHPDEDKAHCRNYQHRRRAGGGGFPYASWEYLKVLFGQCCAYCKQRKPHLTVDHIVPVSKGGWHTSFNIVPACKPCNSRKWNHYA